MKKNLFTAGYIALFFLGIAFIDAMRSQASSYSDLHWWGKAAAGVPMVVLAASVVLTLISIIVLIVKKIKN